MTMPDIIVLHYCVVPSTFFGFFFILHPEFPLFCRLWLVTSRITYTNWHGVFWKAPPGQCNTTGTWRCRDPINQWQYSFNLKAVMPLVKRLATVSDSNNNTGFSPTSCPSVQHFSLFRPTRCRQWKQKSVHRKKMLVLYSNTPCLLKLSRPLYASVNSFSIGSDNGLSPGRCHYLNRCLNIVYSNLATNLRWNLKRNSSILTHQYVFETVVCEMVAVSPRPQCVYRIIQDLEMPCNVDME